jgi:hypothetical protein
VFSLTTKAKEQIESQKHEIAFAQNWTILQNEKENNPMSKSDFESLRLLQGSAGLNCWIAQSGLQSNLMD